MKIPATLTIKEVLHDEIGFTVRGEIHYQGSDIIGQKQIGPKMLRGVVTIWGADGLKPGQRLKVEITTEDEE